MGLTRQQYRTAKENLEKWKIATFKTTNKGTIALLLNNDFFDINANDEQPSKEPTPNHQPTNAQPSIQPSGNHYQEGKEGKEGKEDKKVKKKESILSTNVDNITREIVFENPLKNKIAEFINFRKKIKKPIKEESRNAWLRMLTKMS